MQLADSFMDLPAWGFWGVVVAVAGIPIGVWAARTGERQSRLFYELTGTTRLLSQPETSVEQLEVSWNGMAIKDPHVTTLHIAMQSRRDIREDAFARGESFIVDVGVPIMAVLDRQYRPADGQCPAVDLPRVVAIAGQIIQHEDEGQVRIGPDLIHRDADLRLTLLTDGAPKVVPPRRTLVDVDLRPGPPPTTMSRSAFAARVGSAVLVLAATSFAVMTHRSLDSEGFVMLALLVLTLNMVVPVVVSLFLDPMARQRRRLGG